jgi:hypothetical protein
MDLYLDQAYYTQVFKFNSGLLDATPYPNTFLTVDVGQQDFFNTFHKSLVREDSLDGFINQRILQGHVGGSNGITEGIHVGLNFLGSNRTGGSSAGECGPGMPGSLSYDECGQVKEGLFQAASLDYSFMSLKDQTDAFTTTDTFSNYSHNIAANLLYNLPGDIFDDGLITTGASFTHVDFNNGGVGPAAGFFTTADDDTLGSTFFAKWEQWFGEDRTVGAFMDYSFAANSRSNYLVNGPHAQLLQAGLLLNTTFLPTTWNMNKDQLGFAYSVTDPFNTGRGDPWTISQIPTIAQGGPSPYIDHRPEQILEAYYRKYITENISVTPDLQLVFNGNGHNTAISGLIRATFKLPNWNDGGAFDQFGYRDWSQRIAKFKASHASN